jgi:glycine/sarcosine N-methyltransferase
MNAQEFYDRMASDYHLISTGYAGTSERQGEVIARLARYALKREGPFTILDCSCGVGTQAFGLARLGHKVTGTDISPGAIQKALAEKARTGIDVEFSVADMRSLENAPESFDVVISFDNAIAHLTSDADLAFAISNVLSVLRPGGVFIASMRDYDILRQERPTGTMPRRIVDSYGERVYVQTWDWTEDGKSYDLRLFVVKRSGESWTSQPIETRMRAYTRGEIATELEKTGFAASEWVFSEQSHFYQPVLIARKA